MMRSLSIFLAVALGGCGSTDRDVLSADTSVYAVLEVVPREGVGLERDRVGPTRVLAVDLVPATGEDFELQCPGGIFMCSRLASRRGALLLRTSRTAPLDAGVLQDWPVGASRELRGERLDFLAFDGNPLMRLVPAAGEAHVRVEVRMVKKCPARVLRVRYAQVENTGSGVIAIPKRVRRTWVELERPDCFASEDLQPVLSAP